MPIPDLVPYNFSFSPGGTYDAERIPRADALAARPRDLIGGAFIESLGSFYESGTGLALPFRGTDIVLYPSTLGQLRSIAQRGCSYERMLSTIATTIYASRAHIEATTSGRTTLTKADCRLLAEQVIEYMGQTRMGFGGTVRMPLPASGA